MNLSKPPSEYSSVITHLFDAPRELVFKAWSSAEHMAKWFGPHSFSVPYIDWELGVGNEYEIHMLDSDGTVYPSWGVFEEIVVPERIVFRSWAFKDEDGEPNMIAHNTVTFEALGEQTRLTLRVVVEKAGPGMDVHLSGMVEGWTESFEKMAATLR
jgi:uncharacterized protein YndB with AHSA1/START domain